jgi:hypothetical protein
MTVHEILISKLKELGADGLCNTETDCGCGIDDLCPCDVSLLDCVPAKKKVLSKEDAEDSDFEAGDTVYVEF